MRPTGYVGLDLAWGRRALTGVAVLDDAGMLAHVASVVTDDEVAAVLAAAGADRPHVAAVDAPLVVRNATGRRDCERDLAGDFARYQAGPHPSNLSRPHFLPEPRGARLADRFGWVVTARDDAAVPARCIEVYPHPAMVSLFGLDRVIPYKAKSGRSRESLRAAHRTLMEHLERTCGETLGLADSPDWCRLRAAVEHAPTKAALRRVEDQVDAVLCAHLAYLWHVRPAELRVYGTDDAGFIVTPPPPAAV